MISRSAVGARATDSTDLDGDESLSERRGVCRSAPVLALVLALVLAGCLGGLPFDRIGGADDPDALLSACPDRLPSHAELGDRADPDGDALGWESGLWHDDPIEVDQSDGLDCEELAIVLARTMARVENLRDLEFTFTPETRVISRETHRERTGSQSPSSSVRTMRNVLYEALFMVDERTDAVGVQQQNRGTSVGAYYSATTDTIVLVTPDPDRLQINSGLLAHELVHTLQDQHFVRASAPTLDGSNGRLGLTEGDANHVQYRYNQRCSGTWQGTCLVRDPRPPQSRPTADGGLANRGLHLITYQPYSDGPAFVEHLRNRGGWGAVNDAYGGVPSSTEQTIHPDDYPDDAAAAVSVSDESSRRYSQLTVRNEPDHETVGEAGLFAMFMYPYYDSDGETELVPADGFRNRDETGAVDRFDPYDYRSNYSEGWEGDRLIAYRNGDGEHAYVWKLAFETRADAREFRNGYRALLRYNGAEPVDGRDGVWAVPEDEPFGDAFSLSRSGDTILIVNAPDVQELSEVHSGV